MTDSDNFSFGSCELPENSISPINTIHHLNINSLNLSQNNKIAKKIQQIFDSFNSHRNSQLNDLQDIRSKIYLNQKSFIHPKKQNIKELPDIYELSQTLKAHLMENIYSHPDSMFDVQGLNPQSAQFAQQHKAMLVNSFDRMNLKAEMEKMVNSIVESGEATFFVGWQSVYSHRRTLNTSAESNQTFVVDKHLTYDGPCVKLIDPADFVFNPHDKSKNFEHTDKIYRSYQTLSNVLNSINLQTFDKQLLNQLINSSSHSTSTFSQHNETDIIHDNLEWQELSNQYFLQNQEKLNIPFLNKQIEVLEYFGDFQLPNGTVLENWLIVVANGQVVIRFEPNPYIINPFVHANIIEDPYTLRGISPLKVALVLNSIASDILNKQLDALALTINPPYLAPKGCFCGEQTVFPGKIIEYDSALMPAAPVPLNFDSAIRSWDFINFFKSQIESATGIYRNMSGDILQQPRTATEINYSVSAQAIRLNMIIDCISSKLIIPMVKKCADIIANFRYEDELIPVDFNGKIQFIPIEQQVRFGDFFYKYGDRKASLDRKSRFQELFNLISTFSKMPDFATKINWIECFKFALEQFGLDNCDRFLTNLNDLNNKSV